MPLLFTDSPTPGSEYQRCYLLDKSGLRQITSTRTRHTSAARSVAMFSAALVIAFTFSFTLALPQNKDGESVSSTEYTRFGPAPASTGFPVIYVAGGILDCGAPLVPAVCVVVATFSPSSDAVTYTYPGDTGPIIYTSVPNTVTIFQTEPSFSPFITTSSAPPTLSVIPRALAVNPIPVATTPVSPYVPVIQDKRSLRILDNHEERFSRRAAWDICQPGPLGSMVTNSLVDVCDFVAGVQDYFISMEPTPAAHLPTWPAYLVQLLLGIWAIVSLPNVYHGFSVVLIVVKRRSSGTSETNFLDQNKARIQCQWSGYRHRPDCISYNHHY